MQPTPKTRPLIFIPTYNERENVERLCHDLLALGADLDILFMDDHSPDGTGEVLEGLAKKHPNIRVAHRSGKLGVGSAHFEGIGWAYDQGYSRIITMDCDFTHPPKYVLDILEASLKSHGPSEFDSPDVIIGSRYMQKKSLRGWNLVRKLLTWTGHALTRVLLGMPYDATGGFRLYRLDKIPRQVFSLVRSKGYSFFFESLYILHFNKFKIQEIPIALPPRTYGHSKMDLREIKRSVELLLSVYLTTLFDRGKFELNRSFQADHRDPKAQDTQGWDDYWQEKKNAGGLLYDLIAAFYRKFIIQRALNYFTKRYFRPGTQVLHAGCGSGQVDRDVIQRVSVTGLDISVHALNFYLKTHKGRCKVLHGSIFKIPLEDQSMDGIYNLGVMEHFSETEIYQILAEFGRVLKTQGRLIIFWPPEFGISVVFLKGVKWFLENVMGKKGVKLHPDEITRVRSRKHVEGIFDAAGFKIIRYYFGPLDFFTYSVIVAEKPTPPMQVSGPVQSSPKSSFSTRPQDLLV